MRGVRGVVAAAVVLVAAACSSGTDTSSATDAPAPATTSPPTTTRPASGTSSPQPQRFTTTTDLVYMTVDDVELRMDVSAPDGPGPWPVAVVFHGRSDQGKDAASNTTVAAAAAAAGMVVFAPTWYAGDPFPIGIDDLESLRDAGNCAVAYAQQHAADHGGDAARTAVHGFSAGTGPALASVLDPSEAAIAGCNARPDTEPVAGAVLGDGEYFWQSEAFDDAFRDDLDAMQASVATFTDPAVWPDDLDATFFLWAAADGTAPRQTGDPYDDAGWLAQRDPTGSIRSDLERLDQLADGIVSYIDSAQLLELRLAEDDRDVTLTIAPGGHTVDDKVPDLVGWLAAAGR
jgi:acetyl esterase/lipase